MAEWTTDHIAGLMSGTSVDGVDAAVFRVTYRPRPEGTLEFAEMELTAGVTQPLPEPVRAEILALFEDPPGGLERAAVLNMVLGGLFADAVETVCRKAGLPPASLRVIGSHGQTIRHVAAPRPLGDQSWRASFQIAEGSLIAQRCGAPVVWNFRPADIAAGGTGAPLVPFLDKLLLPRYGPDTVFLNIGGIANLSAFMPGCTAFDTGPGNMIADRLALVANGGVCRYDRDGAWGRRGTIDGALADRWLEDPYYRLPPPKSAGREDFGVRFWDREIAPRLAAGTHSPEDLLRTAEHLTARSVAAAVTAWLPRSPTRMIVCGGGARNPLIMADLAALLDPCPVVGGDEVGLSIDFKEAQAFAVFGLHTLLGLECTVPEATGASRAVAAGTLSLPFGGRR